jgi:MFS family permease
MLLRRVALFGVRFWVYSGNELWVAKRPIWSVSDYGDFGCPQSLEAANKPCSTPARSSNWEDGMSSSAHISGLSVSEHRRMLTRAAFAATIGTTIEWYDFFLYGTATGLVFGTLYFPNQDPLVATLDAFGVYAVGFVARPVGAAIFGHFGDRIGRKSTLIATLMLMGVATVLVGLVPTYATIGIWGAVILTILRFIQGVGVGGEWGGSVLMSMEWAGSNSSRGLAASWPQMGVPAGLFTANLAVLAFSAWSGDAFLTWGWRIPFLLSVILIVLGLWIRLSVEESPTFKRLASENRIEKAPALTVMRQHRARSS